MKTTEWIIAPLTAVALAGIILGVSGCKEKESSPAQSQSGNKAVQYTCSMHPDFVQDKAGKCPKCGMELSEKR